MTDLISNIKQLCELGVAGINIEDSLSAGVRGLLPIEALQERLAAISAYLKENQLDLFINARSDAFLLGMVGAPYEPSGGFGNIGGVHVYSGADGSLLFDYVSPTIGSGGQFGFDISPAGDLDGDGVPDAIIAANNQPGAFPDLPGRVYAFSSNTKDTLYTITSPQEAEGEDFGHSVSAIADINGDGRNDILIGAPKQNAAGIEEAGRAYIFSGINGGFIDSLVSPNSEIVGQFGIAVSFAGDVNNDGTPDMQEFTDQSVTLDSFMEPAEIRTVEERVMNTESLHQKVMILQNFLATKLQTCLFDSLVLQAAHHINRQFNAFDIRQTAAGFGLGRRQFERRFQQSVGLSPRKFANILRFQKALFLHQEGENWADIVDICGYYDQSHFIREMKSHSSFSPSQVLTSTGPRSLKSYFNYHLSMDG